MIGEWLSEIVWAIWIAFGAVWEIVTVWLEKRDRRFEPLTRVYRDKLMRIGKVGWIFRLAWFFLFCWWMVHWIGVPGW